MIGIHLTTLILCLCFTNILSIGQNFKTTEFTTPESTTEYRLNETRVLNTIGQIGINGWKTNCTDYHAQFEEFGECLGVGIPENNTNLGYWSACGNFGSFQSCRITFDYYYTKATFGPVAMDITSYINGIGARIRVSTPKNSNILEISRGSKEWITDRLVFDSNDLWGPLFDVYIDIENDFSGVYSAIIDQISINGIY